MPIKHVLGIVEYLIKMVVRLMPGSDDDPIIGVVAAWVFDKANPIIGLLGIKC